MPFQIAAPTAIQVCNFTFSNISYLFWLIRKMYDVIMTCIDWFLAWPFQVAFCIQSATKIILHYYSIICCHNEDCVIGYTVSPPETSSSECLCGLCFCRLLSSLIFTCLMSTWLFFFCLSSLGSVFSPSLFLLPCLVLPSNRSADITSAKLLQSQTHPQCECGLH